jgi:hypothetical protein
LLWPRHERGRTFGKIAACAEIQKVIVFAGKALVNRLWYEVIDMISTQCRDPLLSVQAVHTSKLKLVPKPVSKALVVGIAGRTVKA